MIADRSEPRSAYPDTLCELCAQPAVVCFPGRDLSDDHPVLRYFCQKHGREYAAEQQDADDED